MSTEINALCPFITISKMQFWNETVMQIRAAQRFSQRDLSHPALLQAISKLVYKLEYNSFCHKKIQIS